LVDRHQRGSNVIRRGLKAQGVVMRPRGRPKGLPQPPSTRGSQHPDRDAQIVRAATEAGLSFSAIGRNYGITRERVRQVLATAGVDTRALVHERGVLLKASDTVRACPQCGELVPKDDHDHWRPGAHVGLNYGGRLSDERFAQWEAIAQDYQEGMKVQAIMAKYHISAAELTRIRHRFNIPTRAPWLANTVLPTRAASAARRAAIIEALKTGKEAPEIAREFGVSSALVHQFLRASGLPRRHPKGPALTEQELQTIDRHYRAGESFAEIARVMNRPRATVWSSWRRWKTRQTTPETAYTHPYDETPTRPDASASAGR
jgi:uncharacterized protein (DUF433 family)